MKDGKSHAGRCVIMKGEPSNPQPPEALQRKFFDLGVPVWGEATTQKLFDALMRIDTVSDFAELGSELTL